MRKTTFLAIVFAAVMFLFSGCSKTDCSTLIPNIKSHFPNATITPSSGDAEKDYFVTVTDFSDSEYDKYIEVCKKGKFSNVSHEYYEEQSNGLEAISDDGNYILSIQLYKEKQSLYINCYKSTKKNDSESSSSSSGNSQKVECKNMVPDVKSAFADATVYWNTGNPETEYFATVTGYKDGEYDRYIEACKAQGYTDISYEYESDKGAGFEAFSKDGHYLVTIQLYKQGGVDKINIACYKHEKNKDNT